MLISYETLIESIPTKEHIKNMILILQKCLTIDLICIRIPADIKMH